MLTVSLSFAENRSWDFTSWSATTLANLKTDAKWDSTSSTRYQNNVEMSGTLQANSVDIAEVSGLTFGACASGKIRIDYGTNPDRLMLNGGSLKITIPSCLAGDTVKLITLTGSTTTARGITVASGNVTRLDTALTSTQVLENILYVNADGDVTVSTTGGLHFRKISVTATAIVTPDPDPDPDPDPSTDIINETFSGDTTALPDGWTAAKYTKYLASALNNSSAAFSVNTDSHVLSVSGSGSGDRGAAVTIPTSGKAEVIDVNFDWTSGNPGTEANKMVELNMQDSLGNSILYFYAENWTGATNHIHCLNIDPTVVPGGANRDVPAVAIAANQSTLVGGADTALIVNSYGYNISARINFASKTVENLTITAYTADTAVFTYKNLSFISKDANEFSRINCATYRNSAANSDGTGLSGNGSNAYLSFTFDNFKVSEVIASNPDFDGGYLLQKDTLFHSDYYYVMLGCKKEYFNNGFYYTYAQSGVTAQGSALSIAPEYCWDITASAIDGQYYMKNVGAGAYLSSFDGAEYSAITLGATPASFLMTILPNTAVTQKGNSTTLSASGQSFAEYLAFRIYDPTLDRILIRGGTQWRKGQNTQTRCDFVEFLYGVPKVDVLKPMLKADLAEAKVIEARTITEGSDLWNYTVGLKDGLSQAITAAESTDTTSWARIDYTIPNLQKAVSAYKEGFVLPTDNYILKVGEKFVDKDAALSSDEKDAFVCTIEKNGNQVSITTGSLYVSTKEGVTVFNDSTAFAYEPIIDGGKVMFVSGSDTLKIQSGDYWFSISKFYGDVVALLKSTSAVNGSASVDTSDIVLIFDQAVEILDATKITLNGVQATTILNNDTLKITNPMTIKTDYVLVIEKGALCNSGKTSLLLDSLGFSFRTFSPYYRDTRSMYAPASFVSGTYALFGAGSGYGYMILKQQISLEGDSVVCALNGTDDGMFDIAVIDSAAKTFSIKNHATQKYLSFNEDSALVMSDTETAWQISFNVNSATTDYQNSFVFWPAVSDTHIFYDCAINVSSASLEVITSSTTATFIVTAMESLTLDDFQYYTEDYFVYIAARNSTYGYAKQSGTSILAGTNDDSDAFLWKVIRQEDGRYTVQNKATGDFITYTNDTTLTANAATNEFTQKWVVMNHCIQNSVTYNYTIMGDVNAWTFNINGLSLSARNGDNGGSAAAYSRIRFVNSNISFIASEAAPVVTIPTITESDIVLNWTANKYAAAYEVIYAPIASMAVDSINTDSIIGFVDSLATVIKVQDALTYRLTGLDKNATYCYQVVAITAGGVYGTASALDSASTVDFADFTPPAPVAVDSVATMKSVTFSWAANEVATAYILTYSLNADMSDSTQIEMLALTRTISGVQANTNVYATITLKNEGGSFSQTSAVGMATTLAYSVLVPEAPVVDTTSITNSSIKINWPAATDAVSYKLRYSRSKAGVVNTEPIDVTDTSYVAENLTRNANYYFTIQAVNANGDLSAQSAVATGKTTNIDAIDQLGAVEVAVFAQSGILYIQTSAETSLSIYNVVGQKVRDVRVQEGMNSVDGLERGQIYLVRVNANVIKVIL